ncbi:C40 family peptidase [Aegicerativicinus sediminis]|uniref:C40 family peptidase n=1 Tax=Aegicerativicinus sediminis TaxID=2893202 RepID=UPI001E51BAC0|nr:C40 family peptidase [Aegicerativicinus sediminis]
MVGAKEPPKSEIINPNIPVNPIAEKVVENAKEFEGVRYKYGGTTKKGMDCSGLVMTAFLEEEIALPRSTSGMSSYGAWVDVKEVQIGDLLFFATGKDSRKVNHVGIVTDSRPGYVQFIHSTTSRGVITSTLDEKYWYFSYVQARRVL